MIDAIRASFKKGLPDLEWMDDKTRRAAEDKVSRDLNKILSFANEKLFKVKLVEWHHFSLSAFPVHLLCSCAYVK